MKKFLQTILLSAFLATGNHTTAQTLTWAKQQGGTGLTTSSGLDLNSNGDVYTSGYFFGTVDFDPGSGVFNLTSAGAADSYISKLDSAGNFLWAKKFTGISDVIAYDIALDDSGNVYAAGTFKGTVDFDPGVGISNLVAAGNQDVYIAKLNSNGNFVWAKRIGGSSVETSNAIALDTLGNIYITGYYEATVDFDPGAATVSLSSSNGAAYILKLNNAGNFIFVKQFIGTNGVAEGFAISVDANQEIYTTGLFIDDVDFDPETATYILTSPIPGLITIFISKLDALGNFVWVKQIDGNDENYPSDIDVDLNGDVITTGEFRQTADFNPGVAVNNLITNGGSDIYILKLDTLGNFVWVQQIGGTGGDGCNALCLDGGNNLYFTGSFEGTVDFNPGANTNNLISSGSYDIFVASLDQSGNYISAISMGGASADAARSIVRNASGEILITGLFQGVCDFDPGAGINNLTSLGTEDAFIVKLSSIITGLVNNSNDVQEIIIFPNPANDIINLRLSGGTATIASIIISDVLGRVVTQIDDVKINASQNSVSIPLNSLANGLYYVTLKTDVNTVTQKFIKN